MRLNTFIVIGFLLPGSFGCSRALTFDAQGVAQGTGEKVYSYKSGAPQLREDYKNGMLMRSRWYKPDGGLVQETKRVDGSGEGIYIRKDGSVWRRMQYVNGIAEGEAKEYDEAGKVTKVMQYRAGQRVSESEPPATRPAA